MIEQGKYSAQRSRANGILTLDVEGWTLSVRVLDGGYEVSMTEDGKCPSSHYVRLDHDQSDTLRDFIVETSLGCSLAEKDHDKTYWRGWNEGIEQAIELLESHGLGVPADKIRALLESPSQPAISIDQGGQQR